jgi:predicted Holliday junction resolvase-like endonuclease
MTELFIILLIIVATFCLAIYTRKSEKPSHYSDIDRLNEALKHPTPTVIEDTSLLKQQLTDAQQKHFESLQEIGHLKSQLRQSQCSAVETGAALLELQQKFDKLQFQNKSSQVKTGSLVEAMIPLTEAFPVPPKSMRFLGSPVDYVSFDYDADIITLVEVKSGESALNENQRKVKSMVERGRVEFKVVRMNEKGITVK